MKSWFAFLLVTLFFSLSASAASVTLDIPPLSTYSPNCLTAPINQQVVTGFSTDGLYLYVQYQGHTQCGSSGRGSKVTYTYWCESIVLDLGGHLISDTPLLPDSTQASYNTYCPAVTVNGNVFTNSSGYSAYTEEVGYSWNHAVAVLNSP